MYRQSKKNFLSSNISSTCPHNTVNFGPLTAEIGSGVWGTPTISMGFASWQRYCTASSSGRQLNFAALNRGRHLCSAGRPSGWALAHILVDVYPARPDALKDTSLYEFLGWYERQKVITRKEPLQVNSHGSHLRRRSAKPYIVTQRKVK